MSTFYFVRHAHTDWTPDEARSLSNRGRRDAERVADILQFYPIQLICSSPFRRAHQTVAPFAARLGLPVHVIPDLRERKLCVGKAEDFFEAVRATWIDATFAHPGGESNYAAQQRGVAVVHSLQAQYPAEHIVLATHGNLLALVLQHFDSSIDFAFWQSLSMPDIYRLESGSGDEVTIHRLSAQPNFQLSTGNF